MGLIRTELMPDSSEALFNARANSNAFLMIMPEFLCISGRHILLLIITCVLPATGMMILNRSILSLEK